MIERMYLFIKNMFMDIQLRHKLLLSYLILIIIPLGFFSLLTYEKFSRNTEKNVLNSTEQNFNLAFAYISDKLSIVHKVSNLINFDKSVNQLLLKREPDYTVLEQLQDLYDFQSYLTSIEYNYDFFRVRLYLKSGYLISNENFNLFNISSIENQRWYREIMGIDSSILWCPPSYFADEKGNSAVIVSAVRKIKNPNDFSETSGLLRVDLDESLFSEIISSANFIENSLTFIINSRNQIIATSDNSQIGKYIEYYSEISSRVTFENRLSLFETSEGPIFLRSSQLENSDWNMVTIIPYSEIFTESKKIRNEVIFLLIIITTISYILATFISFSITKRISRLTKRMQGVQKGKMESIMMIPSKDEIGQLIDNYNYMIKKITLLIDEQYKAGFEIKNSELKALQAQINPHFLYNTMDMILSLSQQNRNSDIETAIRALAKFYRLSLSEGKMIIPLKDEILHVSFYVQIQNIRYPDKIHLTVDIPDDILNYLIPKISLQPIVENSIMHGILRKPEKEGTIQITGEKAEKGILIRIIDDGMGISEEKLQMILNNEVKKKRGSGFGITNINDRIKLLYGDSFGLTFKSKEQEGTTVEILIPANTKNESTETTIL